MAAGGGAAAEIPGSSGGGKGGGVSHSVQSTRKHVYLISSVSYVKMCLHALKHPTSAVNGVLIGKKKTEKERNSGEERTVVEMIDAVAVLHNHTTLAPMMEIALKQIEEEVRKLGLIIIGYYHANAAYDDINLGPAAMTVADKIHSNCNGGACALLLDNSRLSCIVKKESNPGPAFKMFVKSDDSKRKWHNFEGSNVVIQGSADLILEDHVQKGTHRKIVDFDDHMNDITKDWLNPGLV